MESLLIKQHGRVGPLNPCLRIISDPLLERGETV
jgi:hypothetical protein